MDQRVDAATVAERISDERMTALLVEAVEQYSPSYAEEPAMQVFAAALDAAGIPHLRQPVPDRASGDQHGNLIVELGPRPAAMLWVGHVDTVPVIAEEEPATEREGDLLWGLGTADMKSGCAAIVEALTALRESGAVLKRGLDVALVVGEEEYGDGSAALAERTSAPLTVIGEPTGLVPCLDHYGYYEYRLAARGRRVHAALPELGASAIHAMLTWLTAIFEQAWTPPHGDDLAINPRELRGGGDLFVVAEDCEALIDVHARPGIETAAIEALIQAALDSVSKRHPGCVFDFEQLYGSAGYAADPADPRFSPVARAFEGAGIGWAPAPFRSHSDGPIFHRLGSATVVCGPGQLEVAHTRAEHVSLAQTAQAARLYAAMIHEACVA